MARLEDPRALGGEAYRHLESRGDSVQSDGCFNLRALSRPHMLVRLWRGQDSLHILEQSDMGDVQYEELGTTSA